MEIASFSEVNTNTFVTLLSEKLSPQNHDLLSIDSGASENYDIIETCLSEAYKVSFPVKSVKFNKYKHKNSPWITNGILISIKFRDKLYKQLRRCKFGSIKYEEIKKNINTYKKILNRSIRIAKRNYYFNIFEECKSNIKKTWQQINSILNRGKTKSKLPENIVIDGSDVSDPKQIANAFNNFFINVGKNLASSMPDLSSRVSYKDYLTQSSLCNTKFSFKEVTIETIIKAIESLKNKTSFGYDKLTASIVKAAKNILAEPLCIIINKSLKSGIFPQKLKIAKVIPVYKKGDSASINNYRPISLLPVVSKVFERIIHTQLIEYLQSNHLLFPHQYGFRQGHSTELAITEFIDRILGAMSRNKVPLSIYIDLSKAFDTLDHNILLSKLSFYGINGTALKLFSTYLSKRPQYVNFNGHSSDFVTITTGVPQGSILGPLLFLIYINDISKASPLLQTLSYADDTTFTFIFNSKDDPDTISQIINTEMSKVDDWLTVNKLSLNVDKTKFMIFAKPNSSVPNITPSIRQISIEKVSEFNFLGVLIDDSLTWKPHINKIRSKISKGAGILSRLKNLLPSNVLLNIYNTLVLPFLNYAIMVWGFSSTNRLLLLQKKAVRSITNSTYYAHTTNLFKLLGLLKVDDLFFLALLKFYFKWKNESLPFYFTSYKYDQAAHSKNTRNNHLIQKSTNKKKYCDECVRYGLIKVLNFPKIGPTSIDDDIYKTNFTYDKLLSKPALTIKAILNKVDTHSLNAFAKYIKVKFLEMY